MSATVENTLKPAMAKIDPHHVTFATFNVSFGRNSYQQLLKELRVTPTKQTQLVKAWLNGSIKPWDKALAQAVIQIRNVAAIIQRNQPDVLMLSEFNNDGVGQDQTALKLFQQHYLSVAQSSSGVGGRPDLQPIDYPFMASFATNTGLLSGFDLDNNGSIDQLPGDAWGFGHYHGQYAFALLSKYPLDRPNIRTFQQFKWCELEGATCPIISVKPRGKQTLVGKHYGEPWFDHATWPQVRLSSKNHVDVPVLIDTAQGVITVHLLLSHPTPPVFDLGKNQQQNAAEVQFWQQYIAGAATIYDDQGRQGGLAPAQHFIIMGDLNLDPLAGDGQRHVMQTLLADPRLNQQVTQGDRIPKSEGAAEFAALHKLSHPAPERLTSSFGLAVDHLLPSAQLQVLASGVDWPTQQQPEHKLFVDPRVSHHRQLVSSDHRLVWATLCVS